MRATPMSEEELLKLILLVSGVIITFTAVMYVVFRRFLEKEKERGEQFRGSSEDRS